MAEYTMKTLNPFRLCPLLLITLLLASCSESPKAVFMHQCVNNSNAFNKQECETTTLKQKIQEYQEKLDNLAPEKQNKVIDAQAKLAAENAVKYYLQQYPDKGIEKIVWEFNKGTDSYFLKEKQLIAETKEGKVISTQPLDMSQLIAGSLRNIDNVDDYMAMDDPFRLPPISAQ